MGRNGESKQKTRASWPINSNKQNQIKTRSSGGPNRTWIFDPWKTSWPFCHCLREFLWFSKRVTAKAQRKRCIRSKNKSKVVSFMLHRNQLVSARAKTKYTGGWSSHYPFINAALHVSRSLVETNQGIQPNHDWFKPMEPNLKGRLPWRTDNIQNGLGLCLIRCQFRMSHRNFTLLARLIF